MDKFESVVPVQKIAVMGAGAVGLFYGAKLQQNGFSVEYQTRTGAPTLHDAPLDVKSIWGDFKLKVNAFTSPTQMDTADLVIISCKALPQIDYKSLLSPVIKKKSVILVLQNGINNEEKLQKLFPSQAILAASAFTCISRTAPGQVNHIDYGPVTISPVQESSRPLAEMVVSMIESSGIPCKIKPDYRYLRWEKLLWNIPFNSLSVALGGVDTNSIIKDSHAFASIQELVKETLKIARLENVIISPDFAEKMIKNTRKMKPYKTSMLIDYDNKNEMETETILGEPLRIAKKNGLQTPVLETIYNIMTFLNKRNLQA
ncbi:MAG: 2-dehydropantoate 2-reductase [Leptospirales bacterium]